jgi:hypothetical protein
MEVVVNWVIEFAGDGYRARRQGCGAKQLVEKPWQNRRDFAP